MIALFVALGGSAYALSRGEVKTRHIDRGAVTGPKIANNAVNARKIRNNAVRPRHIANLGDLRGRQGPQGAPGPAGATNVVIRSSGLQTALAGAVNDNEASCEPGEAAIGGGAHTNRADNHLSTSNPLPQSEGAVPTGWRVRSFNASFSHTNEVFVVCASP